ncbi:MAG: hypothetical protein ACRDIF_00920 [Actinomycetota bacterium]
MIRINATSLTAHLEEVREAEGTSGEQLGHSGPVGSGAGAEVEGALLEIPVEEQRVAGAEVDELALPDLERLPRRARSSSPMSSGSPVPTALAYDHHFASIRFGPFGSLSARGV